MELDLIIIFKDLHKQAQTCCFALHDINSIKLESFRTSLSTLTEHDCCCCMCPNRSKQVSASPVRESKQRERAKVLIVPVEVWELKKQFPNYQHAVQLIQQTAEARV